MTLAMCLNSLGVHYLHLWNENNSSSMHVPKTVERETGKCKCVECRLCGTHVMLSVLLFKVNPDDICGFQHIGGSKHTVGWLDRVLPVR